MVSRTIEDNIAHMAYRKSSATQQLKYKLVGARALDSSWSTCRWSHRRDLAWSVHDVLCVRGSSGDSTLSRLDSNPASRLVRAYPNNPETR